MKINITSAKVVLSNSKEFFELKVGKATGEYEKYPTSFFVSKKEYDAYVRACMLGVSEWYPLYCDITYNIRFYPDGMQCVYADHRVAEYFTFPVNELVPYVDQLFELSGVEEFDLTNLIEEWQDKYGPKVNIEIADDVKLRLTQDEASELLSEPVGRGLIARLSTWAEGYSNGNPITAHIVFDGWQGGKEAGRPLSYYWWLSDDTQNVQIVNGGWIAHEHNGKYSYSMHT